MGDLASFESLLVPRSEVDKDGGAARRVRAGASPWRAHEARPDLAGRRRNYKSSGISRAALSIRSPDGV